MAFVEGNLPQIQPFTVSRKGNHELLSHVARRKREPNDSAIHTFRRQPLGDIGNDCEADLVVLGLTSFHWFSNVLGLMSLYARASVGVP